jgi:hypothetical protein
MHSFEEEEWGWLFGSEGGVRRASDPRDPARERKRREGYVVVCRNHSSGTGSLATHLEWSAIEE